MSWDSPLRWREYMISGSGSRAREARRVGSLEVPQLAAVFAEHLREVVQRPLPDRLVVCAGHLEVSDDDDLRLLAHRDVHVGLLRPLRGALKDLEFVAERGIHRHIPCLLFLA